MFMSNTPQFIFILIEKKCHRNGRMSFFWSGEWGTSLSTTGTRNKFDTPLISPGAPCNLRGPGTTLSLSLSVTPGTRVTICRLNLQWLVTSVLAVCRQRLQTSRISINRLKLTNTVRCSNLRYLKRAIIERAIIVRLDYKKFVRSSLQPHLTLVQRVKQRD